MGLHVPEVVKDRSRLETQSHTLSFKAPPYHNNALGSGVRDWLREYLDHEKNKKKKGEEEQEEEEEAEEEEEEEERTKKKEEQRRRKKKVEERQRKKKQGARGNKEPATALHDLASLM